MGLGVRMHSFIYWTMYGLIYLRHHHILYKLSWTQLKAFVLLWDQIKYFSMCYRWVQNVYSDQKCTVFFCTYLPIILVIKTRSCFIFWSLLKCGDLFYIHEWREVHKTWNYFSESHLASVVYIETCVFIEYCNDTVFLKQWSSDFHYHYYSICTQLIHFCLHVFENLSLVEVRKPNICFSNFFASTWTKEKDGRSRAILENTVNSWLLRGNGGEKTHE